MEAGTCLGPYEIVAPIGAGGMGEVYRARDTRLKRDVAIKVLPERLAKDRDALNRFQREAQAVAALSHPNILAIHDVGTEGETSYVVTELLEGETLRERVRRSVIPWRKAVEYGVAIADGLAAAHAKGIIHRDLKPENIFLTKDGVVKILDFGLAHVEATAGVPSADQADTPTITLDTRPGTVLGTINYMSPEQVRGLRTDARSDIFSFGCVLYEMVTGHRAFTGDTSADMMTAILKEEPPSVATSLTDIGPELDRTITRCLEKDAQQRFQSSGDLSFTLRNILSASGHALPSSGTVAPRTNRLLWAFAAVAVIIVGGFFVLRETWTRQDGHLAAIDSLAILPFVNAGGDPDTEYLADEIPASIINSLSRLENLRVVPRESVYHYIESGKDRYELARKLDVAAILTGRISVRGGNLTVSAELVDVANDRQLWGERYSEKLADVLAIEADISKQISEELRLRLTGAEKARLAQQYTENAEAHLAYLRGRFFLNKENAEGFRKAIEYFQQAIDSDPEYALAYTGISNAYSELTSWSALPPTEASPKAIAAAMRALEIDDTLGEAHTSMAFATFALEWDWEAAERHLKRAIELNPGYGLSYHHYAHVLSLLGRDDEAVEMFEQALRIDPLSPHHLGCLASLDLHLGRFDKAEELCLRVLEVDPDSVKAFDVLGLTYIMKGMPERVIEDFAEGPLAGSRVLCWAYAQVGREETARQILDKYLGSSPERHSNSVGTAKFYAGLGETRKALDWLEQAYEKQDSGSLAFIGLEPTFASLHGDPRFEALLNKMSVSPTRPALPLAVKPVDRTIKLIVLPFENLSPEPQEWFSDGITVEMIAQLSRLKPDKLSVIARTTALHYKGSNKTVQQIGRELGIDYVVEGSVQRIDDRVRIFADLVRVSDQAHVWSQDFLRRIEDVFALQSEVVTRIAEGIQLKLTPTEEELLASARSVNPDALDAYLRGLAEVRRGTRDACDTAVMLFDQAIEIDPEFALAHVGRARAYEALGDYHLAAKETMPFAKTAALAALAIDDSLPEAHTALGRVHLLFDWNWSAAKESFERAMKLDPTLTDARLGYAQYLTAMNRSDEAIAQLDMVKELDPASPYRHESQLWIPFMARRFQRTIRECREALEFDSAYWQAHMWLGLAQGQTGEFSAGIYHLREANKLNNTPVISAMLGSVLALAGQRDEARAILADLKEREERDYVCPYELATISINLDDYDEAFSEMDRACEDRALCMPWLQVDPRLEPIRTDPRFDRLLQRVGFEPKGPRLRVAETVEPDRIKLAVLPFEDLGGDADARYLADEIPASIIHTLSALSDLQVIPRSTAFRYKVEDKDTAAIGRDLGATAVLTGQINTRGDTLIIRAELVDVATHSQLWDERYNRKLADIMAIEEDIATEISEALRLQLTGEERTQLTRRYTENAEAYQHYLKGRFHWNKRTETDFKKAIDYFRQAIEQDPAYALGYAALAECYVALPCWSVLPPNEAYPEAKWAAAKALKLDNSLAEAHVSLALVARDYEWDWPAAQREFKAALRVNPGYATAHQWYAEYLAGMGRHQEANAEMRRALELDPLSLAANAAAGAISYFARDYDDAIGHCRRALELEPDYAAAHLFLGWAYQGKGRHQEAVAELESAVAHGAGRVASGYLGHAYAVAGDKEKAQKILNELQDMSRQEYVAADLIALVYLGLGQTDQALAWLDKGDEERAFGLLLLNVDARYDNLRNDPRFDDLVRRIGLPLSAHDESSSSSERPE